MLLTSRIAEVERKQARETARIAVADAQRVAELAYAGRKRITTVQRDMTPTDASIVDQSVPDGAAPIAHRVVNWRRRVGDQTTIPANCWMGCSGKPW